MTAKDLKNALLQEAVQGKLVPQIASEGNARDLLEEIRKEKLSHGLDFANAKSGKRKSKKETALAGSNPCDIKEEEIPFDIPENWCWCRLGEIAEIKSSKRVFEKDYVHEGVPFFRSKEIGDLSRGEGIHTELFITKKHYEELRCNYGVPQVEDILLTSVGSIGNYWICDGREFYYKDGNVTQICHNDFFETKYLTSFLSSPLFYEQVNSSVAGTAYNALTIIKLKSLLFPLPPLAEQKRIVAAIEKFMPLIEEYGKKESALKAINEQIGSLTKKAILQEAVQGKLVPQIDAEGNAKDLLEEIKKEKNILIKEGKIKKEKTLPEISDDEIPFDIPENWCWCRLGEIMYIWSARRVHQSDWKNQGIPFYRAREIGKLADFGYVDNELFISEELYNEYVKTGIPEENDLMITAVGTLGKAYIVKKDDHFYYKDASVISFKNFGRLNSSYLKIIMDSVFMQEQIKNTSSGTTVGTITIQNANHFLIPLPPLAEQKRIVAAIEKMLSLCEKLGV